jgi:hypothetical protein
MRLATQHETWVLGFADEVWWSRFAQPRLRACAPVAQPLRLVEQTPQRDDPDPKALACYGLLLWGQATTPAPVWLRFVDGRPVSGITTQVLACWSARLAAEGKTALLLVWDNASWHASREVRTWITTHNQAVKAGQCVGVRIVVSRLPSKSPWLNPIEPRWMHAKKRVVEPDRTLTAAELEQRVLDDFGCPWSEHLSISVQVA